MKKITVALALLAALGGAMNAVQAALPPQSESELRASAEVVAQVKVLSINKRETVSGKDKDYVNMNYEAVGRVLRTSKGKARRGQKVRFHYWTLVRRPAGWAGPSGQYELPKVGETGTIYAQRSGNSLELVQPNGYAPLKAKP